MKNKIATYTIVILKHFIKTGGRFYEIKTRTGDKEL